MPARREGEANEDRLDDCSRAMGAEQPMHQEELTAAMLGGPHGADLASAMELVMSQSLEDTDGRVDRRMSCAKVTPAVPPTVGHLLIEEIIGDGVETVIDMLEGGEDGEHHPGDARFASASPSIVDAAITLQPLVEQQRASLPACRFVAGRPKSRSSSIV